MVSDSNVFRIMTALASPLMTQVSLIISAIQQVTFIAQDYSGAALTILRSTVERLKSLEIIDDKYKHKLLEVLKLYVTENWFSIKDLSNCSEQNEVFELLNEIILIFKSNGIEVELKDFFPLES